MNGKLELMSCQGIDAKRQRSEDKQNGRDACGLAQVVESKPPSQQRTTIVVNANAYEDQPEEGRTNSENNIRTFRGRDEKNDTGQQSSDQRHPVYAALSILHFRLVGAHSRFRNPKTLDLFKASRFRPTLLPQRSI